MNILIVNGPFEMDSDDKKAIETFMEDNTFYKNVN